MCEFTMDKQALFGLITCISFLLTFYRYSAIQYNTQLQLDVLFDKLKYCALIRGTWMNASVVIRPFSGNDGFYNQIRDYVSTNGSFPFHMVNNKSLLGFIQGLEEAMANAERGVSTNW